MAAGELEEEVEAVEEAEGPEGGAGGGGGGARSTSVIDAASNSTGSEDTTTQHTAVHGSSEINSSHLIPWDATLHLTTPCTTALQFS